MGPVDRYARKMTHRWAPVRGPSGPDAPADAEASVDAPRASAPVSAVAPRDVLETPAAAPRGAEPSVAAPRAIEPSHRAEEHDRPSRTVLRAAPGDDAPARAPTPATPVVVLTPGQLLGLIVGLPMVTLVAVVTGAWLMRH